MTDLDTRLNAVAAELDTAIHAFNQMGDSAGAETQYILCFVAHHLEGIHAKLMREVEGLEDRRLQTVS
jgi:hypothetical protein